MNWAGEEGWGRDLKEGEIFFPSFNSEIMCSWGSGMRNSQGPLGGLRSWRDFVGDGAPWDFTLYLVWCTVVGYWLVPSKIWLFLCCWQLGLHFVDRWNLALEATGWYLLRLHSVCVCVCVCGWCRLRFYCVCVVVHWDLNYFVGYLLVVSKTSLCMCVGAGLVLQPTTNFCQ